MLNKTVQPLRTILREFPSGIKYSFAYGSGMFRQKSDPTSNMLDLIFVVDNPSTWHAENLQKNPDHYAQLMRYLGNEFIAKYQTAFGAAVYYNPLVTTSEGRNIKYGVTTENALIDDLLDWNYLYLAGRLHKPVKTIVPAGEKSQLRVALQQNLQSAVHVALLLLPEHFSEISLYKKIASLSYNGDFRMVFGEDRGKVANIVEPQLENFRKLYRPILVTFDQYMDVPKDGISVSCRQDLSPIGRNYHLNHLPRMVQIKLIKNWAHGKKVKDTEDCLRAIAHDPDCDANLDAVLRSIVWRSSVTQSLKGIMTAGMMKSMIYSWRKIQKMMASFCNDFRQEMRKVQGKSANK